jgi:hypothetical protein
MGVENGRAFPIELARIGAAVIERGEDGNARLLAAGIGCSCCIAPKRATS